MLDEQSKGRIRSLCNEIAKEKNPQRFSELLREMNLVFDSAELQETEKRDGNKGPRK